MKNVLKLAVLVLAISMFTGCLGGSDKDDIFSISTRISGILHKDSGSGAPALNSPNYAVLSAFDISNIDSLKIYIGEVGPIAVENWEPTTGAFSTNVSLTYGDLEKVKVGNKTLKQILIDNQRFELSDIDITETDFEKQILRVQMYEIDGENEVAR